MSGSKVSGMDETQTAAARLRPTGRDARRALRIGMVGAGVMARVHSIAPSMARQLYPALPLVPEPVVVADVNLGLARDIARRFGYERAERDWRSVVEADDVDLVCTCLPPVLNRDVAVAAASAGKHVLCEKPLAATAAEAREMLDACVSSGVAHAMGTAYRWAPALRSMRSLIREGRIGEIRHLRAVFHLDYACSEDLPLSWRFRSALAGGGAVADTGFHLIDCARFLVGEIANVVALTARFVQRRRVPAIDAWDITKDGTVAGRGEVGDVDVEDAAAALVHFENGAYGVIETSRVASGRRVSMRIEVYGSKGALEWDLERIDEFQVYVPDDPFVDGFRRVLVSQAHPGGKELLIAVAEATGIGWLGPETTMWAEFISALAEGRPAEANFEDGLRACEVVDAMYESAETGRVVQVRRVGERVESN